MTTPSVDSSMHFQVTVRYGGQRQRYHTYLVEAPEASAALAEAARLMPSEIALGADLVEMRIAVDPDSRAYVEDQGG